MQVQTPISQEYLSIACAECGISFSPQVTKTKICPTCVSKKNEISEGIPKQLIISWCKYCQRYCGPPWKLCKLESKELLALCLKKIRGLKRVKLIDASFIWTEEHSRRIKVQLTVQKTINQSITLEQSFVVEFTVIYTQCDDCKKDFTPHTWKACIQLRQKSINKKTFYFLEQLMLRYNAHSKAIKISKRRDGLDFYFETKSHAQKLVDFLRSAVPTKIKDSKELVSQDDHSNIYKYKYTWLIEIPGVCREDLVLLPKKLCKTFGGVNSLNICYKVGSKLFFYDPITLQKFQMSGLQFFNYQHDIRVIPFKGNETKFLVNDIYGDKEMANTLNSTFANIQTKFAHVEVTPEGSSENFCTITHMGHILKHGDTVTGYHIESLNSAVDLDDLENQKYLPDVLVIRKFYERKKKKKRIWKLKRMKIEEEEELETKKKKNKALEIEQESEAKDFDNFMDELEQNKYMRSKINLYVNEEKKKEMEEVPEEPDEEMIQLNELMKDLKVPEKEKKKPEQQMSEIDQEIENFIKEMAKVKVQKD
jgi:nonsense-mediated mRNA decay protein 3